MVSSEGACAAYYRFGDLEKIHLKQSPHGRRSAQTMLDEPRARAGKRHAPSRFLDHAGHGGAARRCTI